jgi:Domain of Unknown Function (DUF1259)
MTPLIDVSVLSARPVISEVTSPAAPARADRRVPAELTRHSTSTTPTITSWSGHREQGGAIREETVMLQMVRRYLTIAAAIMIATAAHGQPASEWAAVEQALGFKGAEQPGDVFRVGMPRSDLKVTVQGVPVRAGFALGSYAAFRKMGTEAMVMGDLVLLDEEVARVMRRLMERGFRVTGLHNHLNEMSPHVMYMHYSGHGDPVQLAMALREALNESATPRTASPPPTTADASALDQKQIEMALGRSGRVNGGILQVVIGRAERITEDGMELLPAMGVATVLNFQPTGDGKAAITGDFVLVAPEVNEVARTLRDNGIEVTAIHNHALADAPRLIYMHFWAHDDVMKLARALRAALDRTNSTK